MPGLQGLMNICEEYSRKWRFTSGIAKSRCATFGNCTLLKSPSWMLGNDIVENTDVLELLGVKLRHYLKCYVHTDYRISAARSRAFSLQNVGFAHLGLDSEVKCYLWKTTVHPILVYGAHCLSHCAKAIQTMEKFQSNSIKRIFGFSKRSHHSKLLGALNIRSVSDVINEQKVLLYKRIFTRNTPVGNLNIVLLGQFLGENSLIPGTLLSSVVGCDVPPLLVAFSKRFRKYGSVASDSDGVIDSLRSLIFMKNFNHRNSKEKCTANLLVRAF